MNTRLEPPAVELPPGIELRVRHRILRATRTPPRRSRRWLPAVASAAAVVTVVAAIAVATDRTRSAGEPAAAGTEVPSVDAGPVTGPERDSAIDACRSSRPHAAGAQVRYVRRVVDDYSTMVEGIGIVVVLRASNGTHVVCDPGVGGWPKVASALGRPVLDPTPSQPLVPVLPTAGWVNRLANERTSVVNIYQVHPSITRLEVRMTRHGQTGDWFQAALVDGIAYAAAFDGGLLTPPREVATSRLPTPQRLADVPRIGEFRAFDSNGNSIPLPTPIR